MYFGAFLCDSYSYLCCLRFPEYSGLGLLTSLLLPLFLKKCSASLTIGDIQIKTNLRFHFNPISMRIIKNTSSNKCWQGSGDKGTLIYCWGECKLAKPLWKAEWRFLQKLGMVPPFYPVIPLLALYPKHLK